MQKSFPSTAIKTNKRKRKSSLLQTSHVQLVYLYTWNESQLVFFHFYDASGNLGSKVFNSHGIHLLSTCFPQFALPTYINTKSEWLQPGCKRLFTLHAPPALVTFLRLPTSVQISDSYVFSCLVFWFCFLLVG